MGYWRFNEGVGNIFADITANNLIGVKNTANWTTSCIDGTCLTGTGPSNTTDASVPNNPIFNITANVSYSIWVKITDINSSYWPILFTRDTHKSYGFRQNMNDGRVYFEYGIGACDGSPGSYTSKFLSNDSLIDIKWHLLTMTHDSSNFRLYLDGVLKNTTALTSFCSDINSHIHFGKGLSGYIDDARIYNRPLTSTEVKSLYGNTNPQDTPLGCFPQ